MWPDLRAKEIKAKLSALCQKELLRFAFVPSSETDFIQYFPKDSFAADFGILKTKGFEYVPPSRGVSNCDIVIVTAHGSDLSAALWELRQLSEKLLVAVWLWDNHLSHTNNLQTGLAADLIFPSHEYDAGYLINPASVLTLHAPACSAQWSGQLAKEIFARHGANTRSNKLLVNYVDYDFSPRSKLLRRMKTEAPEAEVILMPPEDRSRYFRKSAYERMAEWLNYKASLILPVQQDLSTRVFDALLAGQVVVAPQAIPDFDLVIPPSTQRDLGILRLPDLEISTIRRFAQQAIELFDNAGMDGARKRHTYAVENHLLVNRLDSILSFIKQTNAIGIDPRFYSDGMNRKGLYFVSK